jgi:hypothetical protein
MGIDPTGLDVSSMRKFDKYVKETLPKKYKTSLLEADQEMYEKMAEDANEHLVELLKDQPSYATRSILARKK